MTGLVLWEDLAHRLYTTYGQSHAMEFAYLPPCRVVTGCDDDGTVHYDWSYLETLLDDIKGRSHQAVLRFFYEYPGETMVDGNEGTTAVPAYIKARSDYHETFSHTGDGACYYADWSNAELKRFTKQFYADFAARYASDPRIAFIEVGFGHWSEYHIYDGGNTNIQLGKNFPTKEYQKEFFLHLASVMPIPWAISIDAASTKYAPLPQRCRAEGVAFRAVRRLVHAPEPRAELRRRLQRAVLAEHGLRRALADRSLRWRGELLHQERPAWVHQSCWYVRAHLGGTGCQISHHLYDSQQQSGWQERLQQPLALQGVQHGFGLSFRGDEMSD